MASVEERLDRWERRQETLIAAVVEVVGTLETIQDALAELAKWLEKPPSSDLPELLQALVASVHTISAQMNELPAAVVRAVKDGEVR
jgi:hypothetical protein